MAALYAYSLAKTAVQPTLFQSRWILHFVGIVEQESPLFDCGSILAAEYSLLAFQCIEGRLILQE